MSGYVKTHRSIFSHELFAGDEFSRREAWLWMISEAAWKPHRFRHKKKMIAITRGQLPGARRHLADVWGWGEQRVRTFIDELVAEGMITTSSNQQLTIITVCKYDTFQTAEQSSNQQLTSSQPAANHTEEGKELEEEDTTLTRAEAVRKPMPSGDDLANLSRKLWQAAGPAINQASPALQMVSDPLVWIENGADVERDILPAIAAASKKIRPGSIQTWNYFAGAVRDAMHNRKQTASMFSQAPPPPRRGKYEAPNDAEVLAALTRQPLPQKLTPVLD